MRPVTQSRTGGNGRCFPACLASILELPERAVPDLDNTKEWEVNDFLRPYGFTYMEFPAEDVGPVGYHIITGKSPRGGLHAVVGLNGRMVHDPHPRDGTGRGLARVDNYGILLPRSK